MIFIMFAPKCISELLSKKTQSKRQPNTTTKEFVGKAGRPRTNNLVVAILEGMLPLASKNHNNNKESTTQGGPKSSKNKTQNKAKGQPPN
jgi:hypothetical protein